jgi:hypothetical protein
LLGAVKDLYPGFSAYELIICAFVGVLKSAPATYVMHEDIPEIGATTLHVTNKCLKGLASTDPETATSFVSVFANNVKATTSGVLCYRGSLIFN